MITRILSVRLSEQEFEYFQRVRRKHGLSAQDLLHSIILDAIMDEGYDALRREQSEGREGAGEASEVRGTTTP